MLLYCHTLSPRLQYIADFIGNMITGTSLRLTMDPAAFRAYDGPRINYSDKPLAENEIRVHPHALLFQQGLEQQSIKCSMTNGHKAFFHTPGDLAFDIFSACFYLLSRYEEYLPHQKDKYGRYAHENSLAFKENFLHYPLINLWIQGFKEMIFQKFPTFQRPGPEFQFLPTYDIDEAWSYRHKDPFRTIGAVGKSLLKGEWSGISNRTKVLQGKEQDPFDSYDWMDQLHRDFKLKPRYFFLVAEKTGKYDRNILPEEKALQNLIKRNADKYDIGIHPSWQSGDDPSLIKKEIHALERITGKKVSSSRQHFIRFTLPHTYLHLINAGIKEDFSMGYGSINGFRASVAAPFYWYDLAKEQKKDLLIYPFCFMEANAFFEQKLTAEQAFDELKAYYDSVRSVNGMMVTIWHNTFLGTDNLFKGWREVYKKFIEELITHNS